MAPAHAAGQEPSPVFASLSAGFAFVNVQPGDQLTGTGFRASASIGRRLAPHVAGVAQLELTSVPHPTLAVALAAPCIFPGCIGGAPRSSATGLTLSPGLQLYRMTTYQKLSLTAGPGVLWLFSRPSGTRAVSAVLGAWAGWLVGSGPRLGVRLGAEAWLTDGALPRWAIPATLTIQLP
ncbi:MAG TPA: hypothetical protein VIE46_03390 [Gemmatimonadales bacterium]